jgi:hypothetical protein
MQYFNDLDKMTQFPFPIHQSTTEHETGIASLILRLLKSKFKVWPPVWPVSLAGQTVIVSGGNDGIGSKPPNNSPTLGQRN